MKLTDLSLREVLAALGSDSPAPGAGAAAGLTVAFAAAVVAKAARLSPEWEDSAGAAAQARTLCLRAVELADADARAYAAVLAVRDQPGLDDRRRDARLGTALVHAAESPLLLAGTACDTAMLGALVAEEGDPSLRADALGAAALASAAAQVAADLVAVNLTAIEGDERVARARGFAAEAAAALRSS